MDVEREWCEKHGAVVPVVAGRTTHYYVCPYCGTPATELPEQEASDGCCEQHVCQRTACPRRLSNRMLYPAWKTAAEWARETFGERSPDDEIAYGDYE